MLADQGQQGRKSEAIRVLCDEIDRLVGVNTRGPQLTLLNGKESKGRKKFIPPTMDEIKMVAREIGIKTLGECESFRDHYQANGWKVGRVAMVDWQAAFRNWTRRSNGAVPGNGKTNSIGNRFAIG